MTAAKPWTAKALMQRVLDGWPAGKEFTARQLVLVGRSAKRVPRATIARRAHDVINQAIAEGKVLRLREGTFGDPRDKAVFIKL